MGALLDLALIALTEDASETTTDETDSRRQRVLDMLEADPELVYALISDARSNPVIVTLAIRGKATCEFEIDRDKYDPFLLFDLLQKHGGAVH